MGGGYSFMVGRDDDRPYGDALYIKLFLDGTGVVVVISLCLLFGILQLTGRLTLTSFNLFLKVVREGWTRTDEDDKYTPRLGNGSRTTVLLVELELMFVYFFFPAVLVRAT